ncbi:hypothetical protein F0562_016019 [Nyssa sinensis]|uniref:Uncharacterized protein n=1 Tax=Nyssa sinensis TaxID=561372 RepID=A0A5J4ZIU6_9ASTE|nr:hypothetical protein F0562_016019 [Nyssa sinensis]
MKYEIKNEWPFETEDAKLRAFVVTSFIYILTLVATIKLKPQYPICAGMVHNISLLSFGLAIVLLMFIIDTPLGWFTFVIWVCIFAVEGLLAWKTYKQLYQPLYQEVFEFKNMVKTLDNGNPIPQETEMNGSHCGRFSSADSTSLHSAASAWHDELAPLPKPLLVVNIGGPTSHCQYGADLAKQLTSLLAKVLWSSGSLRISFSRRTPREVSDILVREFSNHSKVYIWDGKDPNPHMGHLAWAAAFFITADSVSMLSEACSTGKPVYVIGAEQCIWKFADFHKSLRERGVV